MNIKQSTLAAAVISACSLGLSANAHADAYAYSYNALTDLSIGFTINNCTQVAGDCFEFNSYSSSSSSSANLDNNNTGGVSSDRTTAATGDPLSGWTLGAGVHPDAFVSLETNAGSTLVVNNNSFPKLGLTPGANTTDYAFADAQIVSEAVNGDTTTATRAQAEALINNVTSAVANAVNSSSTGFEIGFTVGGGPAATFSLAISFIADPFMQAWAGLAGDQGTASMSVSFTMTNTGTGAEVFSWSPDGTAATGLGIASELFDEADLTQEFTDDLADGLFVTFDPTCSGGVCNFSVLTNTFAAGNYSLVLTQNQRVQVSRAPVPEPGILALMGLGLMGLGLARRSTRKA